MDTVSKDKRFAHVARDPRFRRIPRSQKKVKIDKRFTAMFTDKRFKLKYTVDKRGRPTDTTTDENLKRFYDIDSEEDDDKHEDQEKQTTTETKSKKKVQFQVTDLKEEKSEEGNEDEESEDADGEEEEEEQGEIEGSDTEVNDDVREKLQDLSVDYARGEGVLYSESSSEEEDDEGDEEEEEDGIIHDWGELDRDAERTDEATRRLAICHMDWDRIRAVDLLVLMQSFAPQGGSIKSVTIYPSEFGLERLKEEEVHGPKELVDNVLDSDEEADVPKEGEDYHREKLRKYQLMRLKYYYAVAECDSVQTAAAIYDECDGQEFESSSARLDLRFIPDDMMFDQKSHDECHTMPDLSQYEPRYFLTSALQQAHVHLTWDETDPDRQNAMQKLFQPKKNGPKSAIEAFDDSRLKAYLATSSSEDEESGIEDDETAATKPSDEVSVTGESSRIAKYRSLLAEIEAADQQKNRQKGGTDMEMEVTWDFGLKEKADKFVQEKLSQKEKKTPWEEQQEKRKQKRKEMKEQRRKVEKEGQETGESEDDEEKGEGEDDDIPSDIDLNDPYFKEELDNPEFRKPKNLTKKQNKKKQQQPDVEEEQEESDGKRDAELELLLMDEDQDKRKHFNLKDIVEKDDGKKKNKNKNKKKMGKDVEQKTSDDFEVKVDDPRFSALFTSHHYNVDPSDPNFKKTAGMEAILREKQKRRADQAPLEQAPPAKAKKESDPEISRLVRSVKMKTALRKN